MMTQTSPTKCQDFFCPYFLHNQAVSGLSDKPPTKVVLSPSATWPTRRMTPAYVLLKYKTWHQQEGYHYTCPGFVSPDGRTREGK